MSTLKKKLSFPPPAAWLPTHRYDGQFWNTSELTQLLAVRFGAAGPAYPKSREYRALISVIRARNNTTMHRKGYGLDWMGLKWVKEVSRPVPEKGAPAIKSDVAQYLAQGRLPASVLPYICEHLREAQVRAWADRLVSARPVARVLSIAAE